MNKSEINFNNIDKNKIIKFLIYIFILIILWITMFWYQEIEILLNSNYYKTDSYNLISGENLQGKNLKAYFIDVGCADATFIEFPDGKKALIDCAGDSLNVEKSCQALSLFLEKDVFNDCEKVIDYLVITHPDSDHYSDAVSILKDYTVLNIIRPKVVSSYEKELFANDNVLDEKDEYQVKNTDSYSDLIDCFYNEIETNKDSKMFFIEKGLDFSTSDYSFNFLSPSKNSYDDWNNYSPFIRISYKERSITLVGDAEEEVENEVLDEYGVNSDKLKTDVLKLAHHGSNSSTSYALLRALNPEVAVVSTRLGVYENVPSSEVFDRVKEVNSDCSILRTDENGNILICVDENGSLSSYSCCGSFYYVCHYVFVRWISILICVSVLLYILIFRVRPKSRKEKEQEIKRRKEIENLKLLK